MLLSSPCNKIFISSYSLDFISSFDTYHWLFPRYWNDILLELREAWEYEHEVLSIWSKPSWRQETQIVQPQRNFSSFPTFCLPSFFAFYHFFEISNTPNKAFIRLSHCSWFIWNICYLELIHFSFLPNTENKRNRKVM